MVRWGVTAFLSVAQRDYCRLHLRFIASIRCILLMVGRHLCIQWLTSEYLTPLHWCSWCWGVVSVGWLWTLLLCLQICWSGLGVATFWCCFRSYFCYYQNCFLHCARVSTFCTYLPIQLVNWLDLLTLDRAGIISSRHLMTSASNRWAELDGCTHQPMPMAYQITGHLS